MDFVRQYPSMTFDDYFWRYSGPLVRLMSMDGTSVRYLTEKQAKALKIRRDTRAYEDIDLFMNDLGLPIE